MSLSTTPSPRAPATQGSGTASASEAAGNGSATATTTSTKKHHSQDQRRNSSHTSNSPSTMNATTMTVVLTPPSLTTTTGAPSQELTTTANTTSAAAPATTPATTPPAYHLNGATVASTAAGPLTTTTIGGIAGHQRPARTGTALRSSAIRHRQKVKEFNDVISCFLCRGYLVNATTIDYCVHSFCRSCIVKHLEKDKHCPQCRPGSKQINLSNLRPDERLKSLVYKLVPSLYQNEHQRQLYFGNEASASRGEDYEEAVISEQDEEYFSPVEPISLSLEYHPQSLSGCDKQQIPPVRYLQCPAAVTVHHLKRFISSKFDIDLDNQRVDIEIIYDDEILPEDFSLMDVGYCYDWNRTAPMRFFYRILVHNLCNNLNKKPIDTVLTENEEAVEAKRAKKSNETESQKQVRFKEAIKIKHQPDNKTIAAIISSTDEPKTKYSVFKTKSPKTEQKDSSAFNNNNNNNNNNNDNNNKNNNVNNISKVKIDDEKPSEMNGGKGSVKMTIISRKSSNDMKVKQEPSNRGKNHSAKTSSAPATSTVPLAVTPAASVVISDFKSLRSNDMRYYSASSSSTSAPSSKHKSSSSKSKSTNSKEASAKTTQKCDIVVSIPHSNHRSSNSSDDSFENMSLAQLKTANKKNLKQSNSMDVTCTTTQKEASKPQRMDVPKLKIELPSLKTKITVPKKSAEVIESKKSSKHRKKSADETPPSPATSSQVDLATYAKTIGLKPVSEERADIKNKPSPGDSPLSSSTSSSAASTPPSATSTGFVFTPEGIAPSSSSSSHKKRKKAKHSKEPKEPGSKRRKLHAEISSQPADESLKLKVKITANHKSHKSERKASSSSDDVIITSPPPLSKATESPKTSTSSTVTKTQVKPYSENTVPPLTVTIPKEKPHGSKHTINIPKLNKTLSEEVSHISNLIKEGVKYVPGSRQSQPSTSITKQNIVPGSIATKMASTPVSSVAATAPVTSTNNATTHHRAILPKIVNIQETKLPASPPLPPSLFKSAPLTFQSVPTNSAKSAQIQPIASAQVQPRLTFNNDVRHLTLAQLNRLVKQPASRTNTNFAVPNPPRTLPNSPKLSPISSIASAANRQAAQLKRSASLDGNPSTITKQQKMEQDRLARKSSYTPFIGPPITSSNIITTKTPTPPVVVTPTTYNSKTTDQTYYTSTMGASYTHEIPARKAMPILLPPSSISVTKMSDSVSGKDMQSSSNLVVPQHQQKPALEIVRISSNIPPIDQQKLPITNNNTLKQSPPKTTRPPPPPIPLVKIKRSANQANPLKPILSTVRVPVQQAITQTIMTPSVQPTNGKKPISSATTPPPTPVTPTTQSTTQKPFNGMNNKKSDEKPTPESVIPVCDNIGPLDLSGKSSRSPSAEKSSSLDTPPKTPSTPPVSTSTESLIPLTGTTTTTTTTTTNMSNLEAALNKAKQEANISSPSTLTSVRISSTSSNSTSTASPKTTTTTASLPGGTTSVPGQMPKLQSQKSSGTETKLNESANNFTENTEQASKPAAVSSSLATLTTSVSTTNSKQIGDCAQKTLENVPATAAAAVDSQPKKNSSVENTTPVTTAGPTVLNNSNLQNLKLLSDSATNREKITIKNQRQLPMLSKLNEVNKLRLNPTVRQQNASVRNIPNPSALAFRSQQPIPMLASITKTSSPPKVPIPATVTSTTTVSTTPASSSQISDKLSESLTTSTSQSTVAVTSITIKTEPQETVTTIAKSSIPALTSTTDSVSKAIIASKKNLHLEQLAANLNMRAAAAADLSLNAASKSSSTSTTPKTITTTVVTTSTTSAATPVSSASRDTSSSSSVALPAPLTATTAATFSKGSGVSSTSSVAITGATTA